MSTAIENTPEVKQNGTAPASAPVGLYPKLAAAIAEVDRIGKDGTNDHFGYTYTSAEQVYKVIRKPLLERGLIVIPSVDTSELRGQSTVTRLHLRIVDSETGETFEAFWIGEGQDKGDKGPYKAATGGMKTWLKHLFMLPADDDPEADSSVDRPAPEPEPYTLDHLNRVGANVPADDKTRIAAWIFNGTESPDEGRLRQAIDRIEAGDLTGLLSVVEAASA